MEGGAEGSAPAQDSGGDGGATNNGLTTTQSGIPIAPVYAGAYVPYSFKSVLRTRRADVREQKKYSRLDNVTEYRNPYVPAPHGPKGGIDRMRNLAGTGEIYDDPMDGFKDHGLDIDRPPTPIRRPSRPQDATRQRHKGTSIYRKANPSNEDYGRNM